MAPVVHEFAVGLYRLVFALSVPPLMRSVPSGRFDVPVQNMLWPVCETSNEVAVSADESKVEVKVWPPTPGLSIGLLEAQSSRFPLGR